MAFGWPPPPLSVSLSKRKVFLSPSGDLVPSQWWDWAEWKYSLGENVVQVKLWTEWKSGIIENIGLKMLARWKIWLSENVEWKIGVSEIVGRVKMWLCWLSEKFGWVKILKENPSWKKMWTEWKSGLSEKLGRAEILADPTQTCQLGLDVPNWSKP